MNVETNSLRKAAILLSSIDEGSADQLMRQMTPEQAGAVRRAISELRHVDPDEQEAIVREFRFGAAPRKASQQGVELDPGLERALERERAAESAQRTASDLPNYFTIAPLDDLLQALAHERPQTIAVIVSRVPHDRAAQILGSLSPLTRAEVMDRLLSLDETHPEVFQEIERAVRGVIERRFRESQRRTVGVETLRGILGAAGDGPEREALVASLVTKEPAIAADFLPVATETPQWTFSDVESLDDAALSRVLAASDPETRRLALAGATTALFERTLRVLPADAAADIEQQVTMLGPTRLSDVEAAQHDLALLAEQLFLNEGMIGELANGLHGLETR